LQSGDCINGKNKKEEEMIIKVLMCVKCSAIYNINHDGTRCDDMDCLGLLKETNAQVVTTGTQYKVCHCSRAYPAELPSCPACGETKHYPLEV
jgi:hypothetical protein